METQSPVTTLSSLCCLWRECQTAQCIARRLLNSFCDHSCNMKLIYYIQKNNDHPRDARTVPHKWSTSFPVSTISRHFIHWLCIGHGMTPDSFSYSTYSDSSYKSNMSHYFISHMQNHIHARLKAYFNAQVDYIVLIWSLRMFNTLLILKSLRILVCIFIHVYYLYV